ncbi:MAG: PAS domain S-box protein [Candidatus Electrothrix sp. GM3_4]|nr:PAS domain S-box protein [Candidatus Electrothrix sp. GM3_4]
MHAIHPIITRIKTYSLIGVIAWSLIILGSLYWNVSDSKHQVYELAKQSAIDNFNKDHAARLWGTSHGGIYVTPSERTPPNPYLAHIPDRDVITTTGKKLTLMNPAYMLRQMMNDYSKLYGIKGKITGLVVLNPINRPDQWEINAINSFKKGVKEVVDLSDIDGVLHLRLMRPMWMTKGCKKCHEHLGFKEGDIRGGVGVSIPMRPYQQLASERIFVLISLYGVIWISGIFGIYFIFSRSKLFAIENQNSEESIRALNLELEQRIEERTKELQEKESRLSAIVNSSPEGIITANEKGIIESVNPETEKLFGYTSKELIGRNVKMLVPTPYHLEHDNYISTYLKTLQSEIIGLGRQVDGQRKDGRQFPIYLAIRHTQIGTKHLFTGMMHDLSKEVEAEELLKKAKEQAERANEAKTHFLANMSHELRTPLNAILGFTQMLQRDSSFDDEQQEAMTIIERSGQHLLNLINDVLDISKIEAGGAVLHEKDFDLLTLFKNVTDMFFGHAASKELFFNKENHPDIPHFITADESKIRQVLINLLGNAFKFTEKGGVTLRVQSTKKTKYTHQLHFAIEDTGMGINEEQLESIFFPFVQTEEGASKPAGTGLGLSISRQFVRLMGGDITAKSKTNQGSVFSFDITVRTAEAPEAQESQPLQRVIGIAPEQPAFRIQVVEDIPENRTLLVNLMRNIGFEVREAVNGKQGVELFHAWQPHLIWMDLRMPVMDGYEAVQQIKQTEIGQKTVIIALSAHALQDERTKIFRLGCDDFVSKPYAEQDLFAIMEKHLGVLFLYEGKDTTQNVLQNVKHDVPSSALLTKEELILVPESIQKELLVAAAVLDQEACLALLDQLKTNDPTIVSILKKMAKNYEFESLEKIFGTV